MYADFFGLAQPPFNNTFDPRFYWSSPDHESALASLVYTVGEMKGIILLTGESGTGKTFVSRLMLAHFGRRIAFAQLGHTHLTADNLLKTICHEFDLNVDPTADATTDLNTIEEYLVDQFAAGQPVALVIDDAHLMSTDALDTLRSLIALESQDAKLLQIILIGQPQLATRLEDPRLAHIRQRCFRRCRLNPLTRQQTQQYLKHRIEVSQGTLDALFCEKSIDTIHDVSDGLPRLINAVCDNTLLSAFADDRNDIDSEFIRAVADKSIASVPPTHDQPYPDPSGFDPVYTRSATQDAPLDRLMIERLARLEGKIEGMAATRTESPGELKAIATNIELRLAIMESCIKNNTDPIQPTVTQQATDEAVAAEQAEHELCQRVAAIEQNIAAIANQQLATEKRMEDDQVRSTTARIDARLESTRQTARDAVERLKSRRLRFSTESPTTPATPATDPPRRRLAGNQLHDRSQTSPQAQSSNPFAQDTLNDALNSITEPQPSATSSTDRVEELLVEAESLARNQLAPAERLLKNVQSLNRLSDKLRSQTIAESTSQPHT
jgi:general secretion pathway protein A